MEKMQRKWLTASCFHLRTEATAPDESGGDHSDFIVEVGGRDHPDLIEEGWRGPSLISLWWGKRGTPLTSLWRRAS